MMKKSVRRGNLLAICFVASVGFSLVFGLAGCATSPEATALGSRLADRTSVSNHDRTSEGSIAAGASGHRHGSGNRSEPGEPGIGGDGVNTAGHADDIRSGSQVVAASYQSAAPIVWHTSLEDAQKKASVTGKPILAAFLGSDWCPPCIALKKRVFNSRQFQAWAADNVVLLEVDFPRRSQLPPQLEEQNEALAEYFSIQSYPTVLFIDSRGRVLGKQGSGNNASQWIRAADGKIHGRTKRLAARQ